MARVAASGRVAIRLRGNIIKNGDFEDVPTFVAEQTQDNWIDGTATGSSTDTGFHWRANLNAGTMAFRFDPTTKFAGTASMKVSTTNATGRGYASTGTGDQLIGISPSVSYTIKTMIKTNNVATDGVGIFAAFFNSSKSFVDGSFSSFITGTNDWQLLTHTFTTHASAAYIEIQLLNFVAGNTSDAWFDNVFLQRTNWPNRVVASNRNLS